jgi:hypothetical protein
VHRDDFIEHWQRTYGGSPLVGHVLRTRLPDRWLRIHSLRAFSIPASQRYARNEAEMAEVLRRHHTVFRDLIGDGGRCVLVHTDYGEVARPAALRGDVFNTLKEEDSELADDFPQRMAAFAYSEGELDEVLVAVANDEVRLVLVVGIDARCILAPYDGGMDIIVETRERRDELRRRYATWLSRDPSGT